MIQRTLRDRVLARSLTVIALLFLNAPASAESIKQTIKIGVLTDMSGVFSDYFGEGSVIAAKLAIEDAGLTLGEAPIELVVADHQNKPDVGTAIARRWFDVDGVNAIVDVPTSSVALAVSSLARQKNKVFMPSSAFTAELTGRSCSPNTVQWTIDNWALANSVGRAVAEAGGRTWYFITADFAFGHDLERVATAAVIKAGGKVLGATRLPLGTTDFASALLKAQSSKADVIAIANAGPDLTNTIKQASEFGLNAGPQKIVGLALIINNVKALGIVGTTGMLAATPFYWDMNEKTRAWARRFQTLHPEHAMPNEMQAGVYAQLMHYFKAVRVSKDISDGASVVEQMKAIPADDPLFGTGSVRKDWRVVHPVYLVKVKKPATSSDNWALFDIVSEISATDAFRPEAEGECSFAQQ